MDRELRRSPRFPISRRGELSHQGVRFPCLVQDISAGGFCIICARNPVVGQVMDLTFSLTAGLSHRCRIQVRHVDTGCVGAQIRQIDEQAYHVFQDFVQQLGGDVQLQRALPA